MVIGQMETATHRLIEAWRACPLDRGPYVLPGDEAIGDDSKYAAGCSSFESFIAGSEFGADSKRLHLHLLPTPYVGNLENARVFLLMLNPGFSAGDYYAQENSAEYRAALTRSIRQENADDEYPLCVLDPAFSWTSGGIWFQSKLREVTSEIAKRRKLNFQDAMKYLSRNLATLEMYPYHSKSFGLPQSVCQRLSSQQLMLDYVKQVLVPRSKNGSARLIVLRQVKAWSLPDDTDIEDPKIVKYDNGQAIAAHLSVTSAGGAAIVRTLCP